MSDLLSIFNKLTCYNIADYYQALYWFCSHNHEGQFSALYSILSTLPYKPANTETSDDCDYDILLDLDTKTIDPSLLVTALRLYAEIYNSEFKGLFYFADKDLYIAQYLYCNQTMYSVYSISDSGEIDDQTNVVGY
jgi:hypothetical protein